MFIVGGSRSARVIRLGLSTNGTIKNLPDGPALPLALSESSIVQWNSNVILTGGKSSNTLSSAVLMLDLNQIESGWELGLHLMTKRISHFSFVLGTQLFVGGGWGQGTTSLTSMEVLNLTYAIKWTNVAEPHTIKVNIIPSMLILLLARNKYR